MEASMHGSFDKQPHDGQSAYRTFSIKLVALPLLVIVALIGMAVSRSSATKWISDAVQAEFLGTEFVGTDIAPDLTPPTQLARPTNQIRTVTPIEHTELAPYSILNSTPIFEASRLIWLDGRHSIPPERNA
jgi:hypothetical protein